MERREFFLRRPLLQFAPGFVVSALFFVPLIVLRASGGAAAVAQSSANDFTAELWHSFATVFVPMMTVAGILYFAIIGYSAYAAAKRPYVVLDAEHFGVPGLKLTWASIRAVIQGSNFGMPCLRVREVCLEELRESIEEYRANSAA